MNPYNIFYEPHVKPADLKVIEDGLTNFDKSAFGKSGYQPLTFLLRDHNGSVVGGVHGNSGASWLYIASLWVSEDLRGKGYGDLLLGKAEGEGIERGCANCYLDTYNPMALSFYQKMGYSVFGELENFLNDTSRYFLRKTIG
jgi:ribosomal protein S18 acetylase RimI-like enzyme